MMIPLAVLAVLSGLSAAAIGFALSYGALRSAAVRWGFTSWQSYAFPVGVDGLIIALYTADLVLAWRQMARPWVRATAHALTAVTIALNVTAAADGMPGEMGLAAAVQQDPGRLLGHAMMPIAYVILTEVARWSIVRTARLEAGGVDDQALTLADWILNTRVTWKVFQHAKTYPATYADARDLVRKLAIYRVWQSERAMYTTGTTQDRAGVLDRMPALLAPYGVSVDEARAIPAEMLAQEQAQEEDRKRAQRKREQELEQQRRDDELADRERTRDLERQEREDAHQARMDALAKEAEEAQQQGQVAELRAMVDGQARAAAHRAEATVATAEIEASTALTAAQRAAEENERQAAAEHAAEESAKIAAARAKEKAESAKVAEESAKEAAALARVKVEKARAVEAEAKAKAESAKVAEESAKVAAAKARVAEAEAEAVEARERTARALLRAVEAEDLAGLTQRERRVRLVARMLLDSVPAEQTGTHVSPAQLEKFVREWSPVTNAQVAEAIGVTSEGTASQHKTDALALIGRGYNHHTGYDPDRTITQQ